MPEFIHNDQAIFYELVNQSKFISRTPILMLHGNGEDMEIFENVLLPLLNSKSFVLMDSRLQGHSHPLENGSEQLSYEAIASDALALMAHLGINEYDIVGYSDGCIAALIMAIRSMSVRKIITVGANTDPSGLTARARREMLFEYKKAEAEGDARTAELMRLMLEEPHITDAQLAGIICEVTVVRGSRDQYISKKHSEHVAAIIPRASHVTLEGAGHDIPATHAHELSELIRNLL